MAENPAGPTEPLDVRRIHYLARLMKRYDLSSLDLADGQVQIRLRRRGARDRLPSPRSPTPPRRPFPPARNPCSRPPPAEPAHDPAPGRQDGRHREPDGRDLLRLQGPGRPAVRHGRLGPSIPTRSSASSRR